MTHEVMATQSEHSYARGAVIFAEAAASFDIPVSEAQTHEWGLLLRAAHDLDTILDSSLPRVERETRVDVLVSDVVDGQDSDNNSECPANCVFCELKDVANNWCNDRKATLVDIAMQAKEVGAKRREIATPFKLGRLALFEGRLTSQLFALDTASTTGDALGYNTWLANLLAAGTVFDSSVDLSSDYSKGLTRVAPTKTNTARVFVIGIPPLMAAVKATKPKLVLPLVGAIKSVADDR